MEPFYFRRLTVYQQAKFLSIKVHDLSNTFPLEERFALSDQPRRASSSVMFNIAEGFGRYSAKERVRFMDIANGSAMETASELELAEAYGYLSPEVREDFDQLILGIVKQLAKLRGTLAEH
ncbi:MAG: four helix bundle protein [Prevotella sp.]|nr:four helix bundle protein [Prevotella sp.]MDD4534755.1 four helix bundle protein [Prevotella sp.]